MSQIAASATNKKKRGRPTKRRRAMMARGDSRISQPDLQDWTALWTELWSKGFEHLTSSNVFSTESQETEHGTVTFDTMSIYPAFNFYQNDQGLRKLLIRPAWTKAWKWAVERQKKFESFLVIGNSWTGKTLLLYYFLIRRIALGLPTFLQTLSSFVWFFHEGGVDVVDADGSWMSVLEEDSEDGHTWALVDSNMWVELPAPILSCGGSPIFIVQATLPTRSTGNWTKHHGSGRYLNHYLEPFTLTELLQVNLLHKDPSPESLIRSFYHQYGPSRAARDCISLSNPKYDIAAFSQHIRQVNQLISCTKWEEIRSSLARNEITPACTGFDFITLVEPESEDRPYLSKANIVSREVLRRLWKAKRPSVDQIVDIYIACGCTLRSGSGSSRQDWGMGLGEGGSLTMCWMLECFVFDLLEGESGIDKPLYDSEPEEITAIAPNLDGVVGHDSFTFQVPPPKSTSETQTERTGLGIWKTSTKKRYSSFTELDHQIDLDQNMYYVPIESRPATCAPFTFEKVSSTDYQGPVLDSEGNILYSDLNPGSEPLEIGLFTLFEGTLCKEHFIKESALSFILRVAAHNGLGVIAIRYVTICSLPTDGKRGPLKINLPIEWRGKVKVKVFPLALWRY